MARTAFAIPALLAIALSPLALAQDESPPVDLNVTQEAEESTVAGLSTTVVIILIVLAVLVVALIVAMASRP